VGLKEILHPCSVAVRQPIRSAEEVLERVADLALCNPALSDLKRDPIVKLLREREAIGSTGLGHGIAIPHCSVKGTSTFVVGMLTLAEPIEFNSIDGQPADLFFFIIGPRDDRNHHIKLLSAISKAVSQAELAAALRAATDPAAAHELLIRNLSYEEDTVGSEKVLFQVFVQNLDHFEAILNLLSSEVSGSISVIETRNAGAYLFRMPLFAAFWSESRDHEGRVILAIAERRATNQLIRQIHEITGDPDVRSGVLVTVQDLTYAAGSLDF
jgi:PTS system nitrogen regulatory IIA component